MADRRADPTTTSKKTYTLAQFKDFYGATAGKKMWAKAAPKGSDEMRRDPTDPQSKKKYSRADFVKFYGKQRGQQMWDKAGTKAGGKPGQAGHLARTQSLVGEGGDTTAARRWVEKVVAKAPKEARKDLNTFFNQPCCLRVIDDWVLNEKERTVRMTDMCDLYKLSMCGTFDKVQQKKPGMRVTFYLGVRPRSESRLEELFGKGETAKRDRDLRNKWLNTMLDLKDKRPFCTTKCLEGMGKAAWPEAEAACNLKHVEHLTGAEGWLERTAPYSVAHSIYLRRKSEPNQKLWGRVCRSPGVHGGFSLAFDVPPKDSSPDLNEWADRCGDELEVIVLAEGPWPAVTWFETNMTQMTAETLASMMMRNRKWSEVEWYARSFAQIRQRVNMINKMSEEHPTYCMAQFSTRRSPRKAHLILNNLYNLQHLSCYVGASSLLTYRTLRAYKWIQDDGHWTKYGAKQMTAKYKKEGLGKSEKGYPRRYALVTGGHAHEGSMAFCGLVSAGDKEFELPVSTLVWHMNYWLHTARFALLPDTYGTACFAHMMKNLKLPAKFITDFRERHGAQRLPGAEGLTIWDTLKSFDPVCYQGHPPAKGPVYLRQDSGPLGGFLQTFPVGEWGGFASNIGDDEDIEESRKVGYIGSGAGGFFGEKPWTRTEKLGGRLDIIAKICRVRDATIEGSEVYPMKLGDSDTHGEWHKQGCAMPAKLAAGPMVSEAERQKLFEHYRVMGEVRGDCADKNAPGDAKAFTKMDAGKRQAAFDAIWAAGCYV